MKVAVKTPVAEGGPSAGRWGNRRDWFPGAGGRTTIFIAMSVEILSALGGYDPTFSG